MPVNFDRAAAFAVMGVLFVLADPKQWVFVACAVVLGAGCIELFQELSPSRHAHLNDALFKAAGGFAGAIAGRCFCKLRSPRPI